jgi:hypothetical protein
VVDNEMDTACCCRLLLPLADLVAKDNCLPAPVYVASHLLLFQMGVSYRVKRTVNSPPLPSGLEG